MAPGDPGLARLSPLTARAHFTTETTGRDDVQNEASGPDLVFSSEHDGLVTRALIGTALSAVGAHLRLTPQQATCVMQWMLAHESLVKTN